MRSLLRERKGATAVEFALVAPALMMFMFLILDGGRMIFTKQALNELAAETARCAAIKASGCDADSIQTWAITRGRSRSQLPMYAGSTTVDVTTATCNGQAGMEQATIRMPYPKGSMTLLPQSYVPATMVSVACFPVAS